MISSSSKKKNYAINQQHFLAISKLFLISLFCQTLFVCGSTNVIAIVRRCCLYTNLLYFKGDKTFEIIPSKIARTLKNSHNEHNLFIKRCLAFLDRSLKCWYSVTYRFFLSLYTFHFCSWTMIFPDQTKVYQF